MLWIIFRNIRQLIVTHRVFFILFIVSQLISILSIMFIYSVSVSQQKQAIYYNQGIRTFTVQPLAKFDRSLDRLLSKIMAEKEDALRGIAVKLGEDNSHADFTYSSRSALNVSYGRYFTEEDFYRGARQVVLSDILAEGQKKVGETFVINGVKYEIIGIDSFSLSHEIPYPSIENHEQITEIAIILAEPPNFRKLEQWREYLQRHFSDAVIGEPEKPDLRYAAENLYKSVSSIAVGLLAVLNFSYLYNFILLKRKGWYASLRICGCSRSQGTLICLAEVFLISTVLFALSAVVFHGAVSPLFTSINENLLYWMSPGDYLVLFLIYLAVLVAVFMPKIISFSRRTPVDLWRKEFA